MTLYHDDVVSYISTLTICNPVKDLIYKFWFDIHA